MPPESIPRRQSKKERPFKLVIYLTKDESEMIERAASDLGRSKSAFGADVILAEAKRVLRKRALDSP